MCALLAERGAKLKRGSGVMFNSLFFFGCFLLFWLQSGQGQVRSRPRPAARPTSRWVSTLGDTPGLRSTARPSTTGWRPMQLKAAIWTPPVRTFGNRDGGVVFQGRSTPLCLVAFAFHFSFIHSFLTTVAPSKSVALGALLCVCVRECGDWVEKGVGGFGGRRLRVCGECGCGCVLAWMCCAVPYVLCSASL